MSESSCRELRRYMTHLISNYYIYFDKNSILNSDGRRLLNELIREGMKCFPELRKLFKEVRKDPTLEKVMKLAKKVLGEYEAQELLQLSIYYL